MSCFAQQFNSPPLKFEHITSDQGLSNRSILAIMKDSKGFLWITTMDGVNRYDGMDFKIFRNDPFDSTTLSSGWPMCITEDKNGIIWFGGVFGMVLNSYNPLTGKFKRYSDDSYLKNLLPDNQINSLYTDKKNTLWFTTIGEGLYSFNISAKTVVNYRHDAYNAFSISDNTGGVICDDNKNNIYIALAGGFDIFNTTTTKFTHYQIPLHQGLKIEDVKIISINTDRKNNVWVCTSDGLHQFNPFTKKLISFYHQKNNNNSLSCDTVNAVCETPDGKLWIGTYSGLDIYDPVSGTFLHYANDKYDPNSLSEGNIVSFCYDGSGKMWIVGEFNINSVNLLPEKFKIAKPVESVKKSATWAEQAILYIYQDHSGKIFVCCINGLYTFNPSTAKLDLYQPEPGVNYLFKDRVVDFIFQDRDEAYWIEINRYDKLVYYNPQTHVSKIYQYKRDHHPDSLSVGYIWDIYQDKNNIIWFGGEEGLCAFNPKSKKFKTYLIDPKNPDSDHNGIITITEMDNGLLWMAGLGLYYYDPRKDIILKPKFAENQNLKILMANFTYSSFRENDHTLWIGTMGQGLFLIDLKNGACRNFSNHDGLPNNVVWGILKDTYGNLWLSTNDGLCRFTPPKNLFNENEKAIYRNYNMSDGIPAKEFAWNDYMKAQHGTMYWSMYNATSGLVYFHPDSLKDNPYITPVYITGLKLFNKPVFPADTNEFLKSPVEFTKEVKLSYRENVISFTFAALSFVHPENNHYAYKLEGFDQDWIATDALHRFANYTNLDAGEYIFKVKASNNDGVWNNTPATIKLIITPPFWETWWFKCLVAVAVAAAVYGLYRFRMNQLLRLQNIRNKIAHDLHDDIGSTLNSISIFSQVAQQEPENQKEALEMIGESSRKVIDAMSDIVWSINPEYDNFEKIIERLRSLSYNLLRAKNIEHTFKVDESLNEIKLSIEDRRNFYLIFKEAINNMVKYSEASLAEIQLTRNQKSVSLTIRDNGKGFDVSREYNGNGLNSMKNRAKEMDAMFMIDSTIGKGTVTRLDWTI